jgi:N-acetylglucosaminyldiphosphoundecaprenol N-acetyl-beta-D-mannosaminyltransferase
LKIFVLGDGYIMNSNKVKILNMAFDSITKGKLLKDLVMKIEDKQKTFVVTANPEIVMEADKDTAYASVVNSADYIIADGIGVVIASRILGNPLPERIAGYDLLLQLLREGNEKNWSAYFLGAKREVIEKAVNNIKETYPYLNISGWHDGYFDWSSSNIADEIAEKKPDLIFVALGFPRQEQWIAQNMNNFDKGIFMGVGGSFDVIAGEVKRAPIIWQRMNLEWLYRLLKQPSRWRRMLVLPLFLNKILNEKFKSNR